jgi:hypothetical protein
MTVLRVEDIRGSDFEWPGPVGDRAAMAADGAVDLAATRAALERDLAFFQGELDAMHAFQRKWNADWNDVTDKREEYSALASELRRAIDHVDAIRAQKPRPGAP